MAGEYSQDDGMEGGADPCGCRGGGPDVRTGTYDGDADGGIPGGGNSPDYAGAPGLGGDVQTGMVSDNTEGGADPAGSTGGQPRPEEWIK